MLRDRVYVTLEDFGDGWEGTLAEKKRWLAMEDLTDKVVSLLAEHGPMSRVKLANAADASSNDIHDVVYIHGLIRGLRNTWCKVQKDNVVYIPTGTFWEVDHPAVALADMQIPDHARCYCPYCSGTKSD